MLHISYGDITPNAQYSEEQLRKHFPSVTSQGFIDALLKKSESSKDASICAYVNLAALLVNQGIDTICLDLARDSLGKPYFCGSDIFFNISHTKTKFAVAIADSEVGIDIEDKTLTKEKMQSIAKRFFLPIEAESVFDRDSFLRIWTFKEAYAKMTGAPLSEVIGKISSPENGVQKIYKQYKDATICVCMKKSR